MMVLRALSCDDFGSLIWLFLSLLQSGMFQGRRSAFHHQRQPVLPLGADHQRGWSGRRALGVVQGVKNRLVPNAEKLGSDVAIQRQRHGRTGPFFHDHYQRRQDARFTRRRALELAVRPNFRRSSVLTTLTGRAYFFISMLCRFGLLGWLGFPQNSSSSSQSKQAGQHPS